MNSFDKIISQAAENAGPGRESPGDYVGPDGLLICGNCGTRKQCRVRIAGTQRVGQSLTEFSTLSFGESPSADVESRLSQILEDNPHQKYRLSAKACAGILNRASRRGEPLPPELEAALILQSRLE